MYALSRGPDHRARFFNRCYINGYLFRTAAIEKNLTTQNSCVAVKGDDSTGNMDWYGVITKIITLDFANQKEVVLFQCDWYDVPAATTKKGRGFSRDQYGIIDVDKTRFRYFNEPYILGTQAEQVFYVPCATKPNWCTVLRMKPRNLFSMPEAVGAEKEGEPDVESLVVGLEDMNVSRLHEDLTNWKRNDMEGVSVDASVIDKAVPVPEPNDEDLDDDDEDDDTYIDDGIVAPVNSVGHGDDDFFV